MSSSDKGGAKRWGRPGAVVLVLLLGVIGTVGAQEVIHYTNDMEFCISCHEMRDNVYQEYKETVHFKSRTGVRVACSDCHVQKDDAIALFTRKIMAAKEVWHAMLGTVDTPEKFDARRLEMAKREWARMKASDSATCRSCHKAEAMDEEQQRGRAWGQHSTMKENGETCIDCHKGIAHKPVHDQLEPEEPEEEQDFGL